MATTNALFTGLSGLDNNQSWLNVIGNNIANSNTTAFKSSNVQFSPQFYVTDTASSGPTSTFGGTNGSQEGMGSQIAQISTDFNNGQIQSDGVDTHMAISGNGFFVVQSTAGQQYTRDGSFTLNANNQLVTSTGAYVQGYGTDASGNVVVGAVQNLTIPLGQATQAKATQNAVMQGNLNSGGVVATGATILSSQAFTTAAGTAPTATSLLTTLVSTGTPPAALFNAGDTITLAGTQGSRQLPSQSFTVTATSTITDLENFTNQALGIDTAATSATTPPPGATLQTTGTTGQLTIIGNVGADNALTLGSNGIFDSTSGTSPLQMSSGTFGAFTNGATGESTHTTISAFDSLGNPITVDVTTVLTGKSATGDTWQFFTSSPDNLSTTGPSLGSGTLTFNNTGQLVSSTGTTVSIDRTGSGASSPLNIDLNFSNVSAFADTSSNLVMSNQDGEAVGTLTSFSMGGDGTITGNFSNGLTKTLGQVVLANFNNPDGLSNQGSNMYMQGPNSGSATIGAATANGTGTITGGALEQSNVDLSHEFTNLILASTGFSASSKVISTANQLLTDLLNSQR
jgi:flagellar hook protein FlgE